MPKLRDLDAELLWKLEFDEATQSKDSYSWGCPDLAQAQGIMFRCPLPGCGHMVICWFEGRGVPEWITPGPGRWTPSGTSIDDLTFVPGNPPKAVSVLLQGGCNWHGFVRNGEATLS